MLVLRNLARRITIVLALVSAIGAATFAVSPAAAAAPYAGIATRPANDGYWTTTRDGLVTANGAAPFLGDTRSLALNKPIVGMTSAPSGNGYWLVATDGGIFTFGDARFFGSTGNIRLNQPIVGMTSTPSGNGYWLVASDGGIFTFGDARFFGSTGNIRLNDPIVGMSATASGHGYWLVARDGGVFTFGDARFLGSAVGGPPVFGLTPDRTGGYSLLRSDGAVIHRPAPTSPVTSTRPPTTTTAPPTTTTTAPPVSASSNPFAARALWVDPHNPAKAQANSWRTSRPADAALMDRMGSTAAAAWIGEWSGDVTTTVRGIVDQGVQANSVPVLIAYNIPGRDCGQWSSGGAAQAADYRDWINRFANGLGNGPAVVVLEPDALAQLDCLDASGRDSRLALLRDAVTVLENRPGTSVYLDAGHSNWHSAGTMASRLRAAGVDQARGFALNVSNFVHTSSNVAYGDAIVSLLGGSHYVIDTSRNGNGSNGEWCNPSGRALGQSPTANTGNANADAFLWLKRPGESDGACNGGPSAGTWWPEYALGLARSAWS